MLLLSMRFCVLIEWPGGWFSPPLLPERKANSYHLLPERKANSYHLSLSTVNGVKHPVNCSGHYIAAG